MKTPRVKDFDPDAKAPSLKSSLNSMPAIQRPKPTPPPQKDSTQASKATERPADEPANRSTDRPTGKHVLIRRGFEWYEYQLAALKKLSLEEQLADKGDGSMSRMVR